MIVVGVTNGSDRTRDLTPATTGASREKLSYRRRGRTVRHFLVDELVPFIRSKYRARPAFILAGHSFGGLLALEVASKRPGAFAA